MKCIDRLRGLFLRPFFLGFTIGIPFCAFKLLFGIAAVRAGGTSLPGLVILGGIVILWSLTDLILNSSRSILDLLRRPAPFEYCIIAQAGRLVQRPRVFLAIDTLLTFGIICSMLWSGWIARLTPPESYVWNGATTLNLISLSIVAIVNEMEST